MARQFGTATEEEAETEAEAEGEGALTFWTREPVNPLGFIDRNQNLPREPLDNTGRFDCRGN